MKTRLMTAAFLIYNNEILLMKRGMHKLLNPGMWSLIGGHIEPDEINDPTASCLREITEETGIEAADIIDFRLRYLTVRNVDKEIRMNYIFTGRLARKCELIECDEGVLHWVPFPLPDDYRMSFSLMAAANHLVKNNTNQSVFVGIVNQNNDNLKWNEL
jgi:8-oxo-dGTP diphosphatase